MSSVMAVGRGALIVVALSWFSLVDAADAPIDLPTVPYEEQGACPFECCTYRVWTVEADTDVRTDRRDNAPVAFRLRKGDHVDGLTGVVITKKLGKAIVRESVITEPDQLKLNPGDTVYVLNYLGEGASLARFLRRADYLVDDVERGTDGVELLEKRRFDVLMNFSKIFGQRKTSSINSIS